MIREYFGNCERKLFIKFDTPRADTQYSVHGSIVNHRDVNPLQLSFVVTRLERYGFEVELPQYTDSPYYALEFDIYDRFTITSDGETWHLKSAESPPPFKKECSCDGRTLLHKGCQCGAVKKQKWGLQA